MTLRARLAAGPGAPAEARRRLDALASELPLDVLEKTRLLASELITNVVRHADLGPGGWVELGVEIDPSLVRVEVRDAGSGFRPPPGPPSTGQTPGWGLFLVERLADRWGADRSHGAVESLVWFEIALRSRRARPA